MVDFSAAVKRPFQDRKKLFIGSLLFMIPFVNLMTSLFGYGYLYNCGKTAMRKNYILPQWSGWENLFVRGILISLIGMIYFLPALVIGISFGLAAVWSIISGQQYGILAIGFGLLGASLLALLTLYVMPSGVLAYTKSGTFGRAFAFRTVFRKAFTRHYFAAWFVAILYGLLLALPAALLVVLTMPSFIGPFIITGVVTYVLSVSLVTMMADAYGEIQ